MQSRCDDKWWNLGIREAIMTSTNGVPINPVLLPVAILLWSPALNSFVFPEGFMTPIMEDVFALLGIPPDGIMCHPNMNKWETKEHEYELPNVTLTDFISSHCKTDLVSFQEECSFYLYWICKYLVNVSSITSVAQFVPIAKNLAANVKVALAPFFLGHLYRSMYLYSTRPKNSHHGPLWFIQLWVYSYFPKLALSPKLIPTPHTYGEMWMLGRYVPGSISKFKDYFESFSSLKRERQQEDFRPFREKKYGPQGFKETGKKERMYSYDLFHELYCNRLQKINKNNFCQIIATISLL